MGPPLAGMWGFRPPFGLALMAVVGHHSFIVNGCVDDMTNRTFVSWFSSNSCFLASQEIALIAPLSVQRGVNIAPRLSTAAVRLASFSPASVMSRESPLMTRSFPSRAAARSQWASPAPAVSSRWGSFRY